ncbi:MAG: hypothetical protein ACJASH_000004 [Bermanella sp.]|jgi:hypothetical protein
MIAVSAMSVSASTLDSALDKGVERIGGAQKAQYAIDNVDNQTRSAEREYRGVLKEVEGLTVYIEQLNKQLSAQDTEMVQIEYSIRQVTLIERQITPLMLRMIEAIDLFVMADVPFLKDERAARVEKLKSMMGRSDVTVAEKYRKVMKAYQTEMDYGRTIESYRGEIEIAGTMREVDFLRTGRISLVFKTLDGTELGVWNNKTKSFENLDPVYKSNVLKGIRIAREQTAPGLIKIPVTAPVLAKTEINEGAK